MSKLDISIDFSVRPIIIDSIKMDNDLKSRWVQALRSGSYRQGCGHLRSEDNCYCALGVLADVIGDCWVSINSGYWSADGLTAELSSDLLTTARMSTALQDKIITLNDTEKRSFSEIANYLESV